MSDFTIAEKTALSEIGQRGHEDLIELHSAVYGKRRPVFSYRYAPSIVTRGEAELFGAAMPRFAIRVYLDPATRSFVNARRVALFAKFAPENWAHRKIGAGWRHSDLIPPLTETSTSSPDELIMRSSCIADSVLVPPNSLRDKYYIASAQLGRAYGEGCDIEGTPFVKHIDYAGGGLCAQASCFMASALLHEYPARTQQRWVGVHGVPEITAIVAEDQDNELPLKGLTWDQILLYFRNVGRSVWRQQALIRYYSLSPKQLFGVALRSYLASGMPVILPVNIGTLVGRRCCWRRLYPSVYWRNAYLRGLHSHHRPQPEHNHAVVLVGCGKRRKNEFLLNDPAALPFMEASLSQLWRCGAYRSPLPSSGKPAASTARSRIRAWLNDVLGSYTSGQFLPVTPGEVRLPLESWFSQPGDETPRYGGLTTIAQLIQQKGLRLPETESRQSVVVEEFRLPKKVRYDPGEFRLVQMGNNAEHRLPAEWRAAFRQISVRLIAPEHRWCWVQYLPPRSRYGIPASLWIWDAERRVLLPQWSSRSGLDMTTLQDCLGLILGLARLNGDDTWRVQYAYDGSLAPASPDSGEDLPPAGFPLKHEPVPSLISSFDVGGYASAAHHWPRQTLPCELYAFMHTDMSVLRQDAELATSDGNDSVLKQLAYWGHRPACANAIAHKLLDAYRKSRIVAMASFFPEISSPDARKASTAIECIRTLINVAIELRKEQDMVSPDAPFVIELVAGSRIEGIWPGTKITTSLADSQSARPDRWYVANRTSPDEAVKALCANLAEAVEGTRAADPRSGVVFALELEPGPLFILNELSRMRFICKLLEEPKYHTLARILGFNLDVAHFSLSPCTPRQLWNAIEIRERVVHAHISDVGHGHFSDAALGEIGLGLATTSSDKLSPFKPWLELITRIASEPRREDLPRFSGYISTELEACKCSDLVSLSVSNLEHLLGGRKT